MKINVLNTMQGLVPLLDEDYELKKRLKLGVTYQVEVRELRNYEFHKKYFKMVRCAWEILNEKQRAFFGENIEPFRKSAEVAAGWFDLAFSMEHKSWIQIPKSISFEKMDAEQFDELYNKVKDVFLNTYLQKIGDKEFEYFLNNF